VYPRWRGEHLVQRNNAKYSCGLSPLARGTHLAEKFNKLNNRFIPAGAGNTAASNPNFVVLNGLSPLARGTH
ncbi:hypothetical protein DD49_16235, partial [Salmonella enterica subsp. enterica serovar Saintpaul]